MSELKCPFCQQELEVMVGLSNAVLGCPKCKHIATIGVWEELIRTRKTLEQSEICCTEWEKQALDYKAENIALSGELERTRKALETLQEFITKLYLNGNITDEQLERYKKTLITALEQKDVKC